VQVKDPRPLKLDHGKPRMDLLPPLALEEIAKVLAFGATKYSVYGECTCAVSADDDEKKLAGCVTPVMSGGSLKTIPSTPRKRRKETPGGSQGILSPERFIGGTKRDSGLSDSESPRNAVSKSCQAGASFAVSVEASVSTTITEPALFEDACASPVTSASAGWKSWIGSRGHATTCPATQVIRKGDHGWRQSAAEWSRYLAACLRHVFKFLGGEDCDPETGLSHMAHAACCVLFVLQYQLESSGNDDRWKP
jgi:hypothetical protein